MAKHKTIKGILYSVGTVLVAGTMLFSTIKAQQFQAAAADSEAVTASLRILATGDLHGQVTAWNYETDSPDDYCGLSKIATLIAEQREEFGEEATLLVDAGDTLYDYSTNYFYDYNQAAIQPIFQAMAMLRYDAITLGNHELDYPWEYLMNQLNGAGLAEVTTVSNLLYDDDGSNALSPSIVTEKTVTLSDGTTRTIKVGIIGATREALSSKRQRYSGFLCGQSIYTSVKAEAEALKADGVDVVIAVIHGGIGVLAGSNAAESPGARLSALKEIDAVVTSHTHEEFPVNNGIYKSYPTVNEELGTVNGTPVVGTGSHASNLGVIDLQLEVDETGAIVVSDGSSRLIPVEAKTKEADDISKMHAKFQRVLSRSLDRTQYPLAEGTVLTNEDCVVSDTALYQLINDAKMEYGASYIQEYLPEYSDYPVIAVTVNKLDNQKEYIKVEGNVDSFDIAKLIAEASPERDSGYIYLYKITGKNLREWLEYSASIYATAGTKFQTILPSFTRKNTGVSTLLNEDYLKDWSNFFLFDGVSYEIDLTQDARYRGNGTLVSSKNKRIVNLTWNGQAVTDSQVFIIVSDTYGVSYSFMPKSSDSIYGIFPWNDGKAVVMDYIERISEFGPISVEPDYNWRFYNADGYEFAFGTSSDYLTLGKQQDWYYKHVIGLRSGLQFFWGKYVTPQQKLNVLLAAGVKTETCRYVPIKVVVESLADNAEIVSMVYRRGLIEDVNDIQWTLATKMNSSTFNVSDNGTYSVLVTDSAGNQKIAHITIDNINPLIVDLPKVTMLTNRRRAVVGVAIPNSLVHVRTEAQVEYTAEADANGNFTVAIDPQPAESFVDVWVSEGTRDSEIVRTEIYRTGPNIPTVLEAKAGTNYVRSTAEYDEIPMVIMNRKVYIQEGQTSRYIKSGIYTTSYTIVETEAVKDADGSWKLFVPELKKGTTLYLYTLDWQNRESLRTTYTVE